MPPVRLAGETDTILVGVRDRLRPFLSDTVRRHIRGAYLGLFPLPRHPERFVLVVSGTTMAEVARASRAFALLNFPLPDSAETLIHSAEPDIPPDHQAIPAPTPDAVHPFSHFGFRTHTFQGLHPEPADLDLFIPADWFAPESAEVSLRLHLAYNAGLHRDSFLEIRINGILERAIQLPEESGAQYRDYRLSFPLRSLKPGYNRITFQAYPVPAITEQCGFFTGDQLKVTLYDDSQIQFPAVGHQAELPDLALLARTGYPYLQRNGAQTHVVVPPENDAVLAAWQLLGKLARIARLPLFRATIGFAPDDRRHQLIVAPLAQLKPAWLIGAPVDPTARWNRWAYQTGWRIARPGPDWKHRLLRWLEGIEPRPARIRPRYSRVPQSGGLGRQAVALSFLGPEQRLVTVLTAGTGLYPATRTLTEPALWSQLQGDLALWQSGSDRLAWQQLGDKVHVGEGFSPRLWLTFHFERHPWHWVAAILALLLVFAWLTHRLLTRFKKAHHPDAEEIAP